MTKELVPTGKRNIRGLEATDLCTLGSALLLEASVVGVALTDAGEVEA